MKKLKDYFDDQCVVDISSKLTAVQDHFPTKLFIKDATGGLEDLELKARVKKIGNSIYKYLPGVLDQKLETLHLILGPPNPGSYGTFNDYFWQWCLSSVVEQYGHEDREASMAFIYELTQRSTGEFAVRPFLMKDPDFVFQRLKSWSAETSFHVRRLCSEGLRPLLPWASKCIYFVDNPKAVFKLLRSLSRSEEKYVLTSVANHMGDMLKLNYDMTMLELEAWSETDNKSMRWLIRHALRNPRKKGDKRAIDLSDKMTA